MLFMMAAAAADQPLSWIDWLLSFKDFWIKLIGLAMLALTLWLILGQFQQSAKLIYHMKAIPEKEWEAPSWEEMPKWKWPGLLIRFLFRAAGAVGKTFLIAARNPTAWMLRKYTIADVTRIWIEHDIFEKRLTGGWANRSDKTKDTRAECLITVQNPGIVSKAVVKTDRYSERVAGLGAYAAGERPGFFCPIKIESGFIAPLHLLSGLLVHFDETWPKILNGFEDEATLDDVLSRKGVVLNFQQIQSYIYYCWLLWGPSIPVCKGSCDRWGQDSLWLQFGFGDENNSINIVGNRSVLRPKVEAFLEAASVKAGANKGVMAIPAGVQGRLYYDHVNTFSANEAAGVAAVKKRGAASERRSLLFVDDILSDAKGGSGRRSLYYSGYLWIMFIVMAEEKGGDRFLPLHPDDRREDGRNENPVRSRLPWKDSIPFFEHGNFADPETCMFGKQQLVEKALKGLAAMVKANGEKNFPLRFAYACAIDDPNCRCTSESDAKRYDQLEFPSLAGGEQIVDLMQKQLTDMKEEAAKQPKAEADDGTIPLWDLILIERFARTQGGFPHSACNLPAHVDHHLEVIEKLNEKLKGKEAEKKMQDEQKKKKRV